MLSCSSSWPHHTSASLSSSLSSLNISSSSYPLSQALKAIVALDTAGLLLGWQFFDHAAHLGGTMFGMWVTSQGWVVLSSFLFYLNFIFVNALCSWYALYGHDLIWKNREPFVKVWHNFRTQGGGGRGGGAGSGGSAWQRRALWTCINVQTLRPGPHVGECF